MDTRSEVDGREMFHPLTPRGAFTAENDGTKDWYRSMARTSLQGPECCSTQSISFHYITTPEALYCLDYLLYN